MRKWYVEKKSYLCLRNMFPYITWNKKELIIINKNNISRFVETNDFVCNDFIYLFVCCPIIFSKNTIRRKIMKQRPNGFIAKSIIKFFFFFFREEYWNCIVNIKCFLSYCILHFFLDEISWPTNPYTFRIWIVLFY